MIKVEETKVRIGKKNEFPSFGFDNEYAEPQLECTYANFTTSYCKCNVLNVKYAHNTVILHFKTIRMLLTQ